MLLYNAMGSDTGRNVKVDIASGKKRGNNRRGGSRNGGYSGGRGFNRAVTTMIADTVGLMIIMVAGNKVMVDVVTIAETMALSVPHTTTLYRICGQPSF